MSLTVPLLVVASLTFMEMLTGRGAWLGIIGCVMAVFGAVMLAMVLLGVAAAVDGERFAGDEAGSGAARQPPSGARAIWH